MTKKKLNPAPLEALSEVKALLDALAFQAPDKVYARLQQQDAADAAAFVRVLKSVLEG